MARIEGVDLPRNKRDSQPKAHHWKVQIVIGKQFVPGAIATDKEGTLWAIDNKNLRIAHLEADGNIVNSFGSAGSGAGQLDAPSDIAISSTMQQSKEVQLRKGDTASIGPYVFTFNGAETVTEANREAIRAFRERRPADFRGV